MLKGIDLIAKLKYEMKHNLDYTNQSVKVPIRDLNLLIELAESNQYRLDMDLMKKHLDLHRNQCTCKNQETGGES